jgi:8-oxo-dGTP pyrophosphatase MutT (NUDIX family)
MIEFVHSVFFGRVLTVNVERVRLPNGTTANLEIAHHPGGAAVVALDAAQRVCMLRQYRHAAGGYVWELPAGKIDHREPPLQTAQRELMEEGGMKAGSWLSLGSVLSSPGVFTEVIHLYLARDLTPIQNQPEEHEVFEVHWRPLDELVRLAVSGELTDSKTLIGIFRAAAHIRGE